MDGPRAQPGADSPEALAIAAQGGSAPAFEALVARFEAPLYRFLFVRTRDAAAAEDLTQESFLRAWQNLARYDPRWRFSTWLYTLAERLCISARRSRARDPAPTAEPEHGTASGAPDPSAVAAERDEGRALWETAARILRPEERSALWLRYAEDLSMEEIGAVLGRPPVTVRVLLFRARGRLAKVLTEESSPHVHDRARFSPERVGGL